MSEKEWVKILKAFGNERRLKMLKLIMRHRELAVGEIASEIRLSFKATSKHVARFSQLGILEGEGRGKRVVYSLNPAMPPETKMLLKMLLAEY